MSPGPVKKGIGVDASARARFAVRCIVVSTKSGAASIGRTYAADPVLRDRLQHETLERGRLLLANLEDSSQPVSAELEQDLRVAHEAIAAESATLSPSDAVLGHRGGEPGNASVDHRVRGRQADAEPAGQLHDGARQHEDPVLRERLAERHVVGDR
jgi:hypothetical protein